MSIIRNFGGLLKKISCFKVIPGRHYDTSKFMIDVGEITTKYETTKNLDEWKYVERLLAPAMVPEPIPKSDYPSGWKPPNKDLQSTSYHVQRTKNHMLPVYMRVQRRGTVRQTLIKKIQGDIWQFEKDLRPFLEDLIKPKPLRLQVNEFAGWILMNGDQVNAIKYWLEQRGY